MEKIAGYVNMGNEGEMLASTACSPFDLICLLEKHFINELNELVYWYDEVMFISYLLYWWCKMGLEPLWSNSGIIITHYAITQEVF